MREFEVITSGSKPIRSEFEAFVESFNVGKLPQVLTNKTSEVKVLQDKVNSVRRTAEDALRKAYNLSPYNSHLFLPKSGSTLLRVEELQEVVKSLAEAQESQAEAMTKSFEFHLKLAEISEWLFFLGCQNIANNETTLSFLIDKLNDDNSEFNWNIEAKKGLWKVIERLKVQKDVLYRQEQCALAINEIKTRLDKIEEFQNSLKTNLANIQQDNENLRSIITKLGNTQLSNHKLCCENNENVETNTSSERQVYTKKKKSYNLLKSLRKRS